MTGIYYPGSFVAILKIMFFFFFFASLHPVTSKIRRRWKRGGGGSNKQGTKNGAHFVKWSYWQRHKRFLQGRLREMSEPLRIYFSNSSLNLMCFAHQSHSNGTPHFPGIIKYSLNAAR